MTTAQNLPANLISSQRYLNEGIVAQKIKAEEFTVVVQEIEIDGEIYQVIVDGHHRLNAALRTNNEPDFVRASDVGYDMGVRSAEAWLASQQNDSDWYRVATNRNVW